jgi:hypothetical protein
MIKDKNQPSLTNNPNPSLNPDDASGTPQAPLNLPDAFWLTDTILEASGRCKASAAPDLLCFGISALFATDDEHFFTVFLPLDKARQFCMAFTAKLLRVQKTTNTAVESVEWQWNNRHMFSDIQSLQGFNFEADREKITVGFISKSSDSFQVTLGYNEAVALQEAIYSALLILETAATQRIRNSNLLRN